MNSRQRRSEKILFYVEPVIQSALRNFIEQSDMSYSEYVRKLVVEDLRKRGLLTDSMLVEHL